MSQNGYLQDSELEIVKDSGANAVRLVPGAAAAFRAMNRDSNGLVAIVSAYRGASGYRSWATQLDMRNNPQLYNITSGIIPGLPSDHGFGICMDLASGVQWVRDNGHRYGVSFPISNDHNHAMWDQTAVASTNYIELNGIKMAVPEFWPNNVIFWPNGFMNSYDNSIYVALKEAFDNGGVEVSGTEGTLMREIWLANDFMSKRFADASASATILALKSGGISIQANVDEKSIAAEVIANLPKPISSFTDTDRAMLDDIANKGELGQALTSTVQLVDDHADVNKDAIISAINEHPGNTSTPLTVTLTGTATQ